MSGRSGRPHAAGRPPVPEDDGACDHLPGRSLPALQLPATAGERIDLSAIPRSSWRRGLELPTFTVAGVTVYKRVTLVMRDGVIARVFYPVFPPDRNAADVLAWLAR